MAARYERARAEVYKARRRYVELVRRHLHKLTLTSAMAATLRPIAYDEAISIINSEPNFHAEALPGFQPFMGRIHTTEDEDDTIRAHKVPLFTAFASPGADPLRFVLEHILSRADEMARMRFLYIIGTLWNPVTRSSRPCFLTVKQLSKVRLVRVRYTLKQRN